MKILRPVMRLVCVVLYLSWQSLYAGIAPVNLQCDFWQNPLGIDLRFVTSVLKITGMLERAGDYAKNTVKRSVKMGEFTPEPVLQKLERMADIIVEMLDLALEAFAEKNTAKATAVWMRDQEIDDLYHDISTIMQQNISK